MPKLTLTQMAERCAKLEARVRDLEDALTQVHKRLPPKKKTYEPLVSMRSYEEAKRALVQLGKGHVMKPSENGFTIYNVA